MRKFLLGVLAVVLMIFFVVGLVVWAPWETKEKADSTYDDTAYLTWSAGIAAIVGSDLDGLVIALDLADYDLIGLWADYLWIDADNALDEIDDYDVSPELAPSKAEFKLALQDFRGAAFYISLWVDSLDPDYLDEAISYLNSATEHSWNAIDLLPD